MCGISGFLGSDDAFSYIIKGLIMLQNRGYDSAGICTVNSHNKMVINKFASTDTESSIDMLEQYENDHETNCIGMGHTRWATHGAKIDINSHPHLDHTEKIAVVHNGIIENYYTLKRELEQIGIIFKSQTDTEVIVNLISIYYSEYGHMEEAINKAVSRLEGTWGLVIMCTDKPNNLYCARHGSPLLIGFGGEFLMVASEQSGFAGFVTNYVCLENGDVVVLRKDTNTNKVMFEQMNTYDVKNITIIDSQLSPDPYPHWTIKEINEQYDAAVRAISLGGRLLDSESVKLGGLQNNTKDLLKLDHLILLGCGTSLHSGFHAVHFFKDLCDFSTVQVFDGAEFDEGDIPKHGNTGLVFLSQSGETKDLRGCVNIGKHNNLFMIGVINVVDSLIAREVDCGVYLNAGREVAVASTKAFTSQVIILSLIAIFFAQIKGINKQKRKSYIKCLHQLPQNLKKIISDCDQECRNVANYLSSINSCFVLGKNQYKSIGMEGSLKMKEIGYIHTESYGMQSLRHGPYSLLEPGTPVMFMLPDDEHMQSTQSVIEEVHSRNAENIVITNKKDAINHCKFTIVVPTNDKLQGLLLNIPMQLIAYYMAIKKGHNPDKPRNLAKVVTV